MMVKNPAIRPYFLWVAIVVVLLDSVAVENPCWLLLKHGWRVLPPSQKQGAPFRQRGYNQTATTHGLSQESVDEKNCLGLVAREPSFCWDISRGPRDVLWWVLLLSLAESTLPETEKGSENRQRVAKGNQWISSSQDFDGFRLAVRFRKSHGLDLSKRSSLHLVRRRWRLNTSVTWEF